jgi:hypothetical protein
MEENPMREKIARAIINSAIILGIISLIILLIENIFFFWHPEIPRIWSKILWYALINSNLPAFLGFILAFLAHALSKNLAQWRTALFLNGLAILISIFSIPETYQ